MFRFIKNSIDTRPGGRGAAVLIGVVVMGLILMGVAGSLMRLSYFQTRDRARYEVYKDEFAASEAALNAVFAHIQYLINYGTPNFDQQLQDVEPPNIEGYTFPEEDFKVVETFSGNELIPQGEQWEGLTLFRRRFQIDVRAIQSGNPSGRFEHPGVALRQTLQLTFIPLYNFAIFYDPTLEIAPGPDMIVNGRVHANGDAYIQAGSSLAFRDRVTVAGNIYHGRHPDSGMSTSFGDVTFWDGSADVTMQQDGGWLDSTVDGWTDAAESTWNDYVRDQSHGVFPLGLPIPSVEDPHVLIERADPVNDSFSLKQEKFEYKAGLKIIGDSLGNVAAVDEFGTPVSLTYTDPEDPTVTKSVVTTSTFFDAREQTMVTAIDVDLSNMIEGNIMPANGILYVSNEDQSGNRGVVRLVNGDELPVAGLVEGFSVATDDPIYIQGDYNTVDRTLAMVAADAINILSNAWDDENSDSYSSRVASETEVNSVLINGIVPSENSTYSGGVENYFRFLEQWSGRDFVFNGSIIQLWESQKAQGTWQYGNPIYTAPNRIWAWDTALGGMNGPPGAPRVVEITKTEWSMPKNDDS